MTFTKTIRYLPPVIWMAAMFYFSSRADLPSNAVYTVDFMQKKIAHVTEYFILTLLWYRALGYSSPALSIIFTLIYAFFDEIHQLFVPNRTGNLRDVGIDFIGIAAASLTAIKLRQWNKYLSPHQTKIPKA